MTEIHDRQPLTRLNSTQLHWSKVMTDTKVTTKHPSIYLLPNLFTTSGLFAGFYAVVAAMKGNFDIAAIAVFIAMIADSLDGRVARLTNTATAFGVQYDSLSDMVAFGVAPALVVYSWALGNLGKVGWLIAFFYTACAALRLARFNAQVEETDKRFFSGLPSPSAAAIVASMVWAADEFTLVPLDCSWVAAVITALVAGLMISNVPYNSFKNFDNKGKVPLIAVVVILAVFVMVAIDPPIVLFTAFMGYALSGPLIWLWKLSKASKSKL